MRGTSSESMLHGRMAMVFIDSSCRLFRAILRARRSAIGMQSRRDRTVPMAVVVTEIDADESPSGNHPWPVKPAFRWKSSKCRRRAEEITHGTRMGRRDHNCVEAGIARATIGARRKSWERLQPRALVANIRASRPALTTIWLHDLAESTDCGMPRISVDTCPRPRRGHR